MTTLLDSPFARVVPAARGDIAAQRSFVADAITLGVGEGDFASVVEGIVFARLAAAHGAEEDIGNLLMLIGAACKMLEGEEMWGDYMDALHGEALALVSLLAERGIDWADQFLPAFMDASTPRAAQLAKIIRGMMPAA